MIRVIKRESASGTVTWSKKVQERVSKSSRITRCGWNPNEGKEGRPWASSETDGRAIPVCLSLQMVQISGEICSQSYKRNCLDLSMSLISILMAKDRWPDIWNPLPRFAYSQCSFHGATIKINGRLVYWWASPLLSDWPTIIICVSRNLLIRGHAWLAMHQLTNGILQLNAAWNGRHWITLSRRFARSWIRKPSKI